MAHRPESEKNTVATMAGRQKVTRVEQMGSCFRFRLNWEKEESDASPFPTISAVVEAVSAEVHGGAMNVPSELVELGLQATIDQTEHIGRKREAMRTRWDTWRGRGRSCAARAMAGGHGARRSSADSTEECAVWREK